MRKHRLLPHAGETAEERDARIHGFSSAQDRDTKGQEQLGRLLRDLEGRGRLDPIRCSCGGAVINSVCVLCQHEAGGGGVGMPLRDIYDMEPVLRPGWFTEAF